MQLCENLNSCLQTTVASDATAVLEVQKIHGLIHVRVSSRLWLENPVLSL